MKIYEWIFVKHYNLSRENRELKDQLEKMEAGAGELQQELADLREVVSHQQSGAEEEKAEVNLRKILRGLTSVFTQPMPGGLEMVTWQMYTICLS